MGELGATFIEVAGENCLAAGSAGEQVRRNPDLLDFTAEDLT